MNRRAEGTKGEALAAEYLKKHGYKIVAMSFSSSYGEIDLIAANKKVIAFVEVKTRKNDRYTKALEAVIPSKQMKIIKTAQLWLLEHETKLQPRFDVIEVYTETGVINHIENAF